MKPRSFKAFVLAGAEGLEVASQPLLRCPKFAFGLERRRILTAAPSSPRFIRHRRRFGDDARHAPRTSVSKIICTTIKNKTDTLRYPFYFLWQGQKDLNPRHAVLETAALPTELYPYIKFGGPSGTRTPDRPVMSRLL